jgi:hypothetical protein
MGIDGKNMGIIRTQLCFNINPDIKQQIKLAAVKRNISMNLWLMRAIYIALSKEEPDSGATHEWVRK